MSLPSVQLDYRTGVEFLVLCCLVHDELNVSSFGLEVDMKGTCGNIMHMQCDTLKYCLQSNTQFLLWTETLLQHISLEYFDTRVNMLPLST